MGFSLNILSCIFCCLKSKRQNEIVQVDRINTISGSLRNNTQKSYSAVNFSIDMLEDDEHGIENVIWDFSDVDIVSQNPKKSAIQKSCIAPFQHVCLLYTLCLLLELYYTA